MKATRVVCGAIAAVACAAVLTVWPARTGARQLSPDTVQVDADDLGGVVTGAKGPEAGVWVIAETTDLPTKFAKIVVTDDRGRYLVARSAEGELQRLGSRLWARGLAEGAGGAGQDR